MSRYAHENPDIDGQYEEEWHRQQRRLYGKESARRRKMFDRAYETLRVIQRIAGKAPASAVMVAGLNRSGQRSGWFLDIGGRLLMWDPRGGYRQEEYDPLPF